MNKNKLSVDYYQNIKAMDTALRVDESFDLIKKNMTVSNVKIAFYYIDGFVSSAIMQKLMIIHAALSYKLVPVGAVRHSGRIPVWPCNHVIANLDFSTGNFGK